MKRREFVKNVLCLPGALAPLYYSCGRGGGTPGDVDKPRVVLIGIDGANWPTLDPLIQKGKLPFWKQLKEQSAWSAIKSFKPTKSSVVWTSIATGKKMEKHGILDFTFLDRNNIEVPFSNAERREPCIWQILDQFGKKSIVVNWFVTHPPDDIDGIMVSDNFRRVVARPPEKLEEYKDSVRPGIYFHKLVKHIQRDYNRLFKESSLTDYVAMYQGLHPGGNFRKVPILQSYRSMALQDSFVTHVSNDLYRSKDFDFFASYIRMPDLVQHFSARMFEENYKNEVVRALKNNTLSPEKHAEVIGKIADIIEPAYAFAENWLESILTYKKYENAYFIIVSDHGFSLYPGGYNHYGLPDGYDAPDGIFMMKGPGVRSGRLENVSVFDIAPTVLALFDLPVGKNMDGRVLSRALKSNRRIKYRTYTLKTETGGQSRKPSRADQEALEELKSIGYIK